MRLPADRYSEQVGSVGDLGERIAHFRRLLELDLRDLAESGELVGVDVLLIKDPLHILAITEVDAPPGDIHTFGFRRWRHRTFFTRLGLDAAAVARCFETPIFFEPQLTFEMSEAEARTRRESLTSIEGPPERALMRFIKNLHASDMGYDPDSTRILPITQRVDRWKADVRWLASENRYVLALALYVYGDLDRYPAWCGGFVRKATDAIRSRREVPSFSGDITPWVERLCDPATARAERLDMFEVLSEVARSQYRPSFTAKHRRILVDAATNQGDPMSDTIGQLASRLWAER